MNGWKKVRLGSICLKIGSGATPKGGATVYVDNGITFIRSQNVYNLKFDREGLVHISDEAAKKLDGVSIQKGDILLNITGDSVARTCVVPSEVLPARVNQHVAIVRPDPAILDYRFLNYYLASPYMQAYMLGLSVGKGASRNAMTKDMIANYEVPCPALEIQHHIASILSAYDNLIDNYRRQIKLLEEAAQRLYKEWFVDLRFPGYEHTKIVDGVPEGWKKNSIDSTIELLSGYAFKSSEFNNKGTYKIVTIKNVKDGQFDGDNVSRIIEIPPKMPKYCRLTDGDILISLTGNVGRVCIVQGENYLLNQRVAKVKSDIPAYTYCLFRSKAMFNEMNNLANGAAQQNLSPIRVGNIQILFPTDIFIQKFEAMVRPIISKINLLNKEINLLAQARDRLLPKLMSGEIKV